MFDNNKNEADHLLYELFPIPEKSLLQTSILLKEHHIPVEDFRIYLYKYMNEEKYHEIDFQSKNITTIFYWYILEKISNYFSCSFKNLILENIFVDDNLDPPLYKIYYDLKSKKDEAKIIKSIFDNLISGLSILSINDEIILFRYFIQQVFLDLLSQGYIFEKELLKYFNLEFNIQLSNFPKISNYGFPQQLEIFKR